MIPLQAPALLCAVEEKALSLIMTFFQGWKDTWTLPNSWRMSSGVMKGREALKGLQGSPLWVAPLLLGWWSRLLGQQGQGSPLGRCWFPVDAECHLLSHRSQHHLGFSSTTPRLGLLGWSFPCLNHLFTSLENLQHRPRSESTQQNPVQVALVPTSFPSGLQLCLWSTALYPC